MLRLALHLLGWLRRAVPLLAGGALAGAVLGLGAGLVQPAIYEGRAVISLEPVVFQQNTLLSMQGLVSNYALQLQSPRLVERALGAAGLPDGVEEVRRSLLATGNPEELTITLRVRAGRPETAVALSRALLDQFGREIEAANRRQSRESRLRVVILEPAWAATRISPRYDRSVPAGAALGLLAAFLLFVGQSWRRATTLCAPLEVERLFDAPTLGMIPTRK